MPQHWHTDTARATQRNPATALSTTSRLSTQNRHFHRQIFKLFQMEKMGSTFYWHFVAFAVPLFVWCHGGIGGGRGPSPLKLRECAFRESVSMRSDGLQLSRLVSEPQESEGVRGKDEQRQSMGSEWEDIRLQGRIEKWQGTFAYHINHSISAIECSPEFPGGGLHLTMSTWSRLGSNSGCGIPSFPWSKSHHVTIGYLAFVECSIPSIAFNHWITILTWPWKLSKQDWRYLDQKKKLPSSRVSWTVSLQGGVALGRAYMVRAPWRSSSIRIDVRENAPAWVVRDQRQSFFNRNHSFYQGRSDPRTSKNKKSKIWFLKTFSFTIMFFSGCFGLFAGFFLDHPGLYRMGFNPTQHTANTIFLNEPPPGLSMIFARIWPGPRTWQLALPD